MTGLIVIIIDDEVKVAQYVSEDAELSSTGLDILDFMKRQPPNFIKNVRESRWAGNEDRQRILNSLADPYSLTEFSSKTGSKILNLLELRPIIGISSIEFALDSLFCTYVYVIDLDRNKLEVHCSVFDIPLEYPLEGRFRDKFHMEAAEAKSDIYKRKYRPLAYVAEFDFGVSSSEFIDTVYRITS